MTSITYSNTTEIKKLTGKFDPEKYQFIICSEEVKPSKKKSKTYDNISELKNIVPPKKVIGQFNDNYEGVYLKYIQEVLDTTIAIMVKAVIENKFDIVLVCSLPEYEMKYLKMFTEYISEAYDIPTGKFKKLVKGDEELTINSKEALEKANDVLSDVDPEELNKISTGAKEEKEGKKDKKDKDKKKKKDKDKKKKKKDKKYSLGL